MISKHGGDCFRKNLDSTWKICKRWWFEDDLRRKSRHIEIFAGKNGILRRTHSNLIWTNVRFKLEQGISCANKVAFGMTQLPFTNEFGGLNSRNCLKIVGQWSSSNCRSNSEMRPAALRDVSFQTLPGTAHVCRFFFFAIVVAGRIVIRAAMQSLRMMASNCLVICAVANWHNSYKANGKKYGE